jgi:hypothetical protein
VADYEELNRANWDDRVPAHLGSEDYSVQAFPFEALPGQMVESGGGEWRLADVPSRMPCTFTLQAVRQG